MGINRQQVYETSLRLRIILLCSIHCSSQNNIIYVTRSRKRGPFPQKSDCELDLSADSVKIVVHTRVNRLTLARCIPKLQSFEYHIHIRAYLGFEISAFILVL